jgi:putative FmdB family regulatory protein
MPTYEYACTACGQHLEVVQSMSDQPLRECGACGGNLRKVFSPIGIVFKGSGFYRTDSRSGDGKRGTKSPASSSDGASKAASDGKSSSSDGKSSSSDGKSSSSGAGGSTERSA